MELTLTPTLRKIERKSLVSPKGFTATGIHCGLKHKKKDLAVVISDVPASVAGVFTTNAIQAAPLKVTKDVVYSTGKMQAILVNSGNANACTGKTFGDTASRNNFRRAGMEHESANNFYLRPQHGAQRCDTSYRDVGRLIRVAFI